MNCSWFSTHLSFSEIRKTIVIQIRVVLYLAALSLSFCLAVCFIYSCPRFGMVENQHSTCTGSSHTYVSLHVYLYQFVLHSTAPIAIVFMANVGVITQIFRVERATHGEESSSTRLTGGKTEIVLMH